MMTFLAIILSNIFIGTIFYLVISLRLEKSAASYQSKRMQREMDEMIREFNATAERNISILEQRISTMRRLLEMSGNYVPLDVQAAEKEELEAMKRPAPEAVQPLPSSNTENSGPLSAKVFGRLRKTLETMAGKLPAEEPKALPEVSQVSGSRLDFRVGAEIVSAHDGDNLDEQAPVFPFSAAEEDPLVKVPDEDEMRRILQNPDRYTVIGDLYRQGCAPEVIARCAGMPDGEVKLILNLQGLL